MAKKISFKKFLKLTESEKIEKYKYLSDHDKFLARMNQTSDVEVLGNHKMTFEDKKDLEEMEKIMNKRIKIMKEMRKNK